EILPTYLHRVFTQFACYQVHGPFYDVGSLWTTCTTICISRGLIREDNISFQLYNRNVISAAGHGESKRYHNDIREDLGISYQIRNTIHLQPRYLAIPGRRNFYIVNLITTMDGSREILTAVFHPFNWAS